MANAFHYSIGRKFIQAVSGAFLVVLLRLHGTINFLSVIDSFTGGWDAADGLFQLGCDFMALPIVTIMVPVLALGIIVHIIYGCYLTWYNIKARGGYKRYEVASKAKADSWSAKNMFVLGIVILGILFFHLTHFWAKMQLPEMFGVGNYEDDPYLLLTLTFMHWWMVVLYVVWFAAVWFHVNHGFWSALQTLGLNNSIWFKRLKFLSVLLSSVIFLMFTSVAINAFLQANCWI